jgi:putative membrane protein
MDTTNNHLANERTFLAWIRTSISIIVFGFVVAKFGIALREFLVLQHAAVSGSNDSLGIGVAFMSVGIIVGIISLIQYRITMRRIDENRFKPADGLITLLGLFVAVFGGVLMAYLILTAQSL